jgi:hypothetical protein
MLLHVTTLCTANRPHRHIRITAFDITTFERTVEEKDKKRRKEEEGEEGHRVVTITTIFNRHVHRQHFTSVITVAISIISSTSRPSTKKWTVYMHPNNSKRCGDHQIYDILFLALSR